MKPGRPRRYRAMREEDIERYLINQVKAKLQGKAPKYTTPGRRSAPDRLLLWANNQHAFVECKRPKCKPTPKQWREIRDLWAMGHNCAWVSELEEVDAVIKALVAGEALDEWFDSILHP